MCTWLVCNRTWVVFTKVDFSGLMIPALVAEGGVSSDAALEKASRLLARLGKLLLLQSFTVLGTNACIQGVLEHVAGLVAHWLQLGLNVSRWILEVLPEVLKWHLSCASPTWLLPTHVPASPPSL